MTGSLAVDLGTSRTLVVEATKGLVVDEPTLAAVDIPTGRLLAFGIEARAMAGRAAGEVAIVRPVRQGQLVDLELTDQIAADVFGRARRAGVHRPEVLCCVPGSATGVQRRALERSFKKAGARRIDFVEHAVACGIGTRLHLDEPVASMVMDVGAGTSDMAVMALGGVVTEASLPVGGNDFDEAIRHLCQRSFDLVLPPGAAESIKIAIGSAWPADEKKVEVRGRDLGSGRPRTVVLSRDEVATVLSEHVEAIMRAAVRCITESPPDLANDLLTRGLYLAGGGGLLDGFARRLATAAGIPIHLVSSPQTVAVDGAARALRAMGSKGSVPVSGEALAPLDSSD
ncbi:MAG: rod shape-determining protein [Acidimicrobiales bacterium]|jgi:rod shape-determining protein MreB